MICLAAVGIVLMVQPYSCWDFKLKDSGVIPPYSNTGVQTCEVTLKPDYLSLSFPAFCEPKNMRVCALEIFLLFCESWKGGTSFLDKPGLNGFEHSKRMLCPDGKELASVHWGGSSQAGRVNIIVRGACCTLLKAHQWVKIHALARRYKARINRFDIACDDWSGKYFGHEQINADYDKEPTLLCPVGTKTNFVMPRDKLDTHKGYTLQFGTANTRNYHVIYQKFRESAGSYLALKNPKWLRWESRFFRRGKVEVDLSILHPDSWASAFLGSALWLERCFKRSGARFSHYVGETKGNALNAFIRAYFAFEKQWAPFVSECDRLGIDLPSRRSFGISPYAALTPYDRQEIMECISRGSLDSACALGSAAYREDLECVF